MGSGTRMISLTRSRWGRCVGFVFYEPSSRYVAPEDAATLTCAVPAFLTRVGLFVNENAETIKRIFEIARLNLIQYHGEESPEFLRFCWVTLYQGIPRAAGYGYSWGDGSLPERVRFLLDAYVKGNQAELENASTGD